MWELGVKRVCHPGSAWFCGTKPNFGGFAQKGEETAHFAKQTIFQGRTFLRNEAEGRRKVAVHPRNAAATLSA
jgi:hypothetical protein